MKYIILSLLLVSTSSFAKDVKLKVLSAVRTANFDLGVGSKVELSFATMRVKQNMTFLGRMITQDGKAKEYLFLDEVKTRISMIDPGNIELGMTPSRTQAVMSPIDQIAGTCVAYALSHFWQQTYHTGFKGSAALKALMSSERERTKFLEETIDAYYMTRPKEIVTVMKKQGARLGYPGCKLAKFTDSASAVDFLYNRTLQGKPVVIDFNVGSTMVSSSYEVSDYETGTNLDPRLWTPRRVGTREYSGHAIVGAAAFMSKGRKKILVLDSNWTEPRVWDLNKYIGSKTAINEMGFSYCD